MKKERWHNQLWFRLIVIAVIVAVLAPLGYYLDYQLHCYYNHLQGISDG